MVTKYCEFTPSTHRNKRPAPFEWLDDPEDKHPLAICDSCATAAKKVNPSAIIRPRGGAKKATEKAAEKPAEAPGDAPTDAPANN